MLCFNRRLADKLSEQAPDGVLVNTYHGFCKEMAENVGVEVDFNKADEPGFWRGIQEELLAATLAGLPPRALMSSTSELPMLRAN